MSNIVNLKELRIKYLNGNRMKKELVCSAIIQIYMYRMRLL